MTVLIKNALVFDGSGKIPFKSDIFINHQRIIRLGNFPHRSAEKVIDARGMITIPGFIDINSSADHYLSLFSDSGQNDILKQGITTIIGGNAGSSLAPLVDGSLVSIRKWAESSSINSINVNWHSVAEFLRVLGERKLAVNFGTLIGHSTIRRAIVGEDFRDLTEKEIKVFNYVLEQGMKDGAFGFSAGLTYAHSHNVGYRELEMLAKTVSKYKGIFSIQLRNYSEKLAAAVNEAVSIAKNTGVNLEISEFEPLKGFDKDYLESVSLTERERMRVNINFDIAPGEVSSVEIYMLLPEWARNGSLEVMLGNIKNAGIRERILEYLENINAKDLVIAKVPPFLRFILGKSLKQFGEDQNLAPEEALLKLMELSKLRMEVLYKNIDAETLRLALVSENAIVASGGALEFLNLVQREDLMPLEKAVVKATSLPAKKFGIKERGMIVEGNFADIVILRDGKPSEVLVNGSVTLENGEARGVFAGRVLKRIPKI